MARFSAAPVGLLFAAASLAAPAFAQSSSYDQAGYYARLDVGAGLPRDAKATGNPVTGQINDLDRAPIVGAGLGYRFNRHFRADITTSYLWGQDLEDTDGGGSRWTADVDAWTTLLNAYFEYPLGAWSPYLTAGIGVSRNHASSFTRSPAALTVDGKTTTDLAWQVGAGTGYDLTANWTLDIGYRYLDAGQFKSGDRASDGSTGNTIKGDLRNHVAMLGLRYSFAVPPAPMATPAPAPAPVAAVTPAPARPAGPGVPELPVLYRVYFDFDKSEISEAAARVLGEAANTAKAAQAQVTRIVATGHADRAGPDSYNMALSIRRANAVKSVLVREGVPERQIVVLGKGEREALVPTADGAREPINRRVEIVIE